MHSDIAAHHNIAFEFNGDGRFDPAKGNIDAFLAEAAASGLPSALLSSEDLAFTTKHPARLGGLRERISAAGYRIVWIVYFRWLPAWLDSAYAELAKSIAVIHRFDRWFESSSAEMLASKPLSLLEPLWSSGDEVRIRSFDIACQAGLIADFLTAIDLREFHPSSAAPSANSRPAVLWVEFFRMLAEFLHANDLRGRREEFVARSRKALPFLPGKPAFAGMSDEFARKAEARSRKAYETVLQKAGFNGNYADFFHIRDFEPNFYRAETGTPEQRAFLNRAFIRTVLNNFEKAPNPPA
jgi:hypothetical protein